MEVAQQGSVVAEIAGEEMILLPGLGLLWPSEKTLFVADLHLGKGTAFRAGAFPVPSGSTKGTLDRLCALVREVGAQRVVVLGDLWHAMAGRSEQSEGEFLEWRKRHCDREVWLVEGNHDLKSGVLPEEHDLKVMSPGVKLGPFSLLHEPMDSDGYGLSGHLHPGARLTGRGDRGVTVPCFWVRPGYAVLPAFGEFTGYARIRAQTEDRVFVIASGKVIQV